MPYQSARDTSSDGLRLASARVWISWTSWTRRPSNSSCSTGWRNGSRTFRVKLWQFYCKPLTANPIFPNTQQQTQPFPVFFHHFYSLYWNLSSCQESFCSWIQYWFQDRIQHLLFSNEQIQEFIDEIIYELTWMQLTWIQLSCYAFMLSFMTLNS